jgi:hypothetical protein
MLFTPVGNSDFEIHAGNGLLIYHKIVFERNTALLKGCKEILSPVFPATSARFAPAVSTYFLARRLVPCGQGPKNE